MFFHWKLTVRNKRGYCPKDEKEREKERKRKKRERKERKREKREKERERERKQPLFAVTITTHDENGKRKALLKGKQASSKSATTAKEINSSRKEMKEKVFFVACDEEEEKERGERREKRPKEEQEGRQRRGGENFFRLHRERDKENELYLLFSLLLLPFSICNCLSTKQETRQKVCLFVLLAMHFLPFHSIRKGKNYSKFAAGHCKQGFLILFFGR